MEAIEQAINLMFLDTDNRARLFLEAGRGSSSV